MRILSLSLTISSLSSITSMLFICFLHLHNYSSNPSALAFLGVLNLRKVQAKDTSLFALKMEKSGFRTAAKPLRSPIFQGNALFLLEKHEIAAFVLVDKSGYFYGAAGGIRPALRGRPGRGSGLPPAAHSLPLPFESLRSLFSKNRDPHLTVEVPVFGAAGGIRTHGTLACTPDFESGPL